MKKNLAMLLIIIMLIGIPVSSSALVVNIPNPGLIITTFLPAAPDNLNVPFGTTQGSTALYFSWNDNSTNETGFIIRRSINGFSWAEAGRVGAGVKTFGDTGLNPSTSYYYTVEAYNSTGSSSTSNSLKLTTNALLTILTPNGGEVLNGGSVYNITWDITGDHNSPIGGDMAMSLYYTADGVMIPINQSSVAAGDGSYLWTVPKISSTNVVISGSFSAGIAKGNITDASDAKFTIQTRGLNLTPTPPSHLSGSLFEPLKAYLEWDYTAAGMTGFNIYRKTGTGAYSVVSIHKATEPSLTDSSLTPGLTYTYKVTAYNVTAYNGIWESTSSNEISVTTTPFVIIPLKFVPLAPSSLTAVSPSVSTADIAWTAGDASATGFKLERKTAAGSFAQIAAPAASATTYADTGLTADTEYSYRIKAVNAAGESLYSPTATVKTLALVLPTEPVTEPVVIPGTTIVKLYVGQANYLVNGGSQLMDTSPIIRDGRLLLPVRYIAEPLGAVATWNPTEQKVTITSKTTIIELWIGSSMAKINGVDTMIDPLNANVKPILVPPGRTMLPLRFIGESLGCKVDWNPLTKEATLTLEN